MTTFSLAASAYNLKIECMQRFVVDMVRQ